MTTNIDICNWAISEVGSQGSIISALNENSNEAKACNLWYDRIRKALIRAAPWGFTRYQVALTQLGDAFDQTAPFPYLYKYAYPADCIKLRYLVNPPPAVVQGVPDVGEPLAWPYFGADRNARFLISSDLDSATPPNEIKVILTNLGGTNSGDAALGVYSKDITNVDLFDEGFIDAFVAALAYRLIMPLTGNVGQREQFRASAEQIIATTRATDGNEAHPSSDHTPDWIAARADGGAWNAWGGLGSPSGWGSGYCTWDDMNWGM